MAFRVVPCRGTDFKHLQDGWMRGIAQRTDDVRRRQAELLRQQAVESKSIALPQPVEAGEFADESFGAAMKEFKGIFTGKGKAPKGSVVFLHRDARGALDVLFQPLVQGGKKEAVGELVRLGGVEDQRVSRLVWLMYLGGANVSSEEARKSVVEGNPMSNEWIATPMSNASKTGAMFRASKTLHVYVPNGDANV
ncbi:hypothetical protein OPT61_g7384 [Boeremia exigua]|uniref:Uncharacterized protein n=1 Tax=Boeremia exigua TaxID=749465 RepID=A0ACC2I2E6_9PLEO|nr:hypothetical protein OPT61_g7384 [Boeremia exigua]